MDSNGSESSIENPNDSSIKQKTLNYDIDISEKNIFVVQRVLSGKKHRLKVTNKNDWSHKLNETIWNVFRKDCSWSFKHADAYANGDVTVNGHCTFDKCNATVRAHCINNKTLRVTVNHFDKNVIHTGKKRRITGTFKKSLEKKLKSSSAVKVRNELAGEMMKPGDDEPPHLAKLATIRKQKSRMNLTKAGSTDPFHSLSEMKQNRYNQCIQDIWMNPLVIMYSTPLQRKYYRSTSLNVRRVITIDGSGLNVIAPKTSSISEKRTSKANKVKYQTIFLYTVHSVDKCCVPLGQMLSQRHTMSFLTYWLNVWCPPNKKPHEVILDQSAALFGACVRAFTHCHSTNEYITACMNSLLYGVQPPDTFCRLDRFHFVRIINNLKQFKSMDRLKVKLLTSVFGVLILCHELEAAEQIIIDLFTVIRHRFVNDSCQKSLENLQKICSSHEIIVETDNVKQPEATHIQDNRISILETVENDTFRTTSSYR